MKSQSTIDLLASDPDFAQFLGADERAELGSVVVPIAELPKGPVEIHEVLRGRGAFEGYVLDGMLIRRLSLGEHPGLIILGPGDVLSPHQHHRLQRSMLLTQLDCHVVIEAKVALLGREVLAAVRHWPQLAAGLHQRVSMQTDRLAVQLLICQLPRVEDRLMAMLWLLAETWGRVRPTGTSLPLSLTHDALGGLVGARRSTVTLALRELADRGSLIRQDSGWLLLDAPPIALPSSDRHSPDLPVWQASSDWGLADTVAEEREADNREALQSTVERLRQEHEQNREKVRLQLEELVRTRERWEWRRRHRTPANNAYTRARGVKPPGAPS